MDSKEINARGLACPRPVVMTREAIEEGGTSRIDVSVDTDVQAENVKRTGESMGWRAEIEERGEYYRVTLTPAGGGRPVAPSPSAPPLAEQPVPAAGGRVVFITSDLFGSGDPELGRVLMRSFIKTLLEMKQLPEKAIFVNSGVKLVTEDSDLIEDIRALEEACVEVLACGTCLDFYDLEEKLQAGRASNMYEIVSALTGASGIIKP